MAGGGGFSWPDLGFDWPDGLSFSNCGDNSCSGSCFVNTAGTYNSTITCPVLGSLPAQNITISQTPPSCDLCFSSPSLPIASVGGCLGSNFELQLSITIFGVSATCNGLYLLGSIAGYCTISAFPAATCVWTATKI